MEIFTIETVLEYYKNILRSNDALSLCLSYFCKNCGPFCSSEGVIRKKAERLIAARTWWHTFVYTYVSFGSMFRLPWTCATIYSPISPGSRFYRSIITARKLILRYLCYWRSAGKKGSTFLSRSHFVALSRFNCVSMFQKVCEALARPVLRSTFTCYKNAIHTLVTFCSDTIRYPVNIGRVVSICILLNTSY